MAEWNASIRQERVLFLARDQLTATACMHCASGLEVKMSRHSLQGSVESALRAPRSIQLCKLRCCGVQESGSVQHAARAIISQSLSIPSLAE